MVRFRPQAVPRQNSATPITSARYAKANPRSPSQYAAIPTDTAANGATVWISHRRCPTTMTRSPGLEVRSAVSTADRSLEHVCGNRELPRVPTRPSPGSSLPLQKRRPSHSPSLYFGVRTAPKSNARKPHGNDALRFNGKHHSVCRKLPPRRKHPTSSNHQGVAGEWTTRWNKARSTPQTIVCAPARGRAKRSRVARL